MCLGEQISHLVSQAAEDAEANQHVQRRSEHTKSDRHVHQRYGTAVPGLSEPCIAPAGQQDLALIEQAELEEDALGICVNVVAGHAIVCAEMIDLSGFLDVPQRR